MIRSIVTLPRDIDNDEFEVYLNGVRQDPDGDYHVDRGRIIFDRPLRSDHISGWRWLLGAFGIGTYRQDDTIDVHYHVNGQPQLKHGLPITIENDHAQ